MNNPSVAQEMLELADELYAAFVSIKEPTPGQREALDNYAKASNLFRQLHDEGEPTQILAAFLKVVRVMKAARNTSSKSMCVWPDDMKAAEDIVAFVETLQLRQAAAPQGREALEPFAKIADDYAAVHDKRVAENFPHVCRPLSDGHRVSIALGDCRKARAALALAQEPGEDKRTFNIRGKQVELSTHVDADLAAALNAPPPQVDSGREDERAVIDMLTLCGELNGKQNGETYAQYLRRLIDEIALRPERSGGR